jgi:succinate dehydrogenase / fumarate reductase cytochrome b subunit
MNVLLQPVRSSLGSKYVMALTGIALIGFVVAHMSGNLLVYAGRDALNTYAATLKQHPALLWAARAGLLVIFVVHVVLGIRLTRQNSAARPVSYAYEDTLQASWASRHMLLTGLVLLAFVVYHLAHFTLGVVKRAHVQSTPHGLEKVDKNYLDLAEVKPAPGYPYRPDPTVDLRGVPAAQRGEDESVASMRHDVYSMVVAGFRNRWITLSYLVAMAFLGLHLWHGGSSWFQSLGLEHPRWNLLIRGFGPVLAVLVVAGNCSIPLAVWLGIVK